jgi:hypothetical protein
MLQALFFVVTKAKFAGTVKILRPTRHRAIAGNSGISSAFCSPIVRLSFAYASPPAEGKANRMRSKAD